jgi:hypothetical protein
VLTPVLVYAAGVAVGLWRVDGSPAARITLALLWPLAIVAAIVTVAILVLAAMVLFPLVGVAGVSVAALIWWLVR